MSGNLEDKISSFRMYGSGPSKTWYIDYGYASSTATATFTLYRGKDYETGTCRYYKWVMSLPGNSTNTWNVSGLSKEKWRGLACANMNDKTSSLSVIFCKNTTCFAP